MTITFDVLLTFIFLLFIMVFQYVVSNKYYGFHTIMAGFTILLVILYYNELFQTLFDDDTVGIVVSVMLVLYMVLLAGFKIVQGLEKI